MAHGCWRWWQGLRTLSESLEGGEVGWSSLRRSSMGWEWGVWWGLWLITFWGWVGRIIFAVFRLSHSFFTLSLLHLTVSHFKLSLTFQLVSILYSSKYLNVLRQQRLHYSYFYAQSIEYSFIKLYHWTYDFMMKWVVYVWCDQLTFTNRKNNFGFLIWIENSVYNYQWNMIFLGYHNATLDLVKSSIGNDPA